MATYSGLWNGVHGDAYALQVNRSSLTKRLTRTLKKRGATRIREVIDTVTAGAKINAVRIMLPTDPLEFTDTDATVTVNHTAHGLSTGDVINISGATVVTGLTSGQVNGARTITVVDADTYTFEAEAAAGATDATAGGSAVVIESNKGATTYKRVQESAVVGDPTAGGGLVPIETVTQIAPDSAVTAADETLIDEITNDDVQPTYPVDASGNGGGGKLAHVQ